MLKDRIDAALRPRPAGSETPAPGLRHYFREADGRVLRFHLRVDPDGSGLLIANASEACRLSASGVLIARGLLDAHTPEHVASELVRNFRGVTRADARAGVDRVRAMMAEMVKPGSRFPLRSLDDASHVGGHALSAPLVADVELPDAARGKSILRKLWDAAVPQSVLLVPEGGDAEACVELVECAEDLGMIVGVRGRATELGKEVDLRRLANAGLDRADLFYAHRDARVHDGLFGERDHDRAESAFKDVLRLEVCPVAVVPLVAATWNAFGHTAARLRDLGVVTIVTYAVVRDGADERDPALPTTALAQATAFAAETADALGMTLVRGAPVRLGRDDKAVDAVRRGPLAAGEGAVRIARDGKVLAPSAGMAPAGDLLHDPWSRIWSSPVLADVRAGREPT